MFFNISLHFISKDVQLEPYLERIMDINCGSVVKMKDGTETTLEQGKAGEYFFKTKNNIVYGGVCYYNKESLIEFLEDIFNSSIPTNK